MELLHSDADIGYGRFELTDLEEMSTVLAESFSFAANRWQSPWDFHTKMSNCIVALFARRLLPRD